MTIDRLGDSTILVTLTGEDMRRYDLDFREDTPSTRRGLTRLMYAVGEECGLSHRDKSYLIEALPGGESCLLIISVRVTKSRRKYRIKRDRRVPCCRFFDTDSMLGWIGLGEDLSGSLYRAYGGYYLLPEYPLSQRERCILSEYAAVTDESPVAAARIREYGEAIMQRHSRHRCFRYSSNAAT